MKSRTKTKSALPYFGGDAGVAAELGALLDHCSHVTIPFVGGASILPHLKARAIVANDLHDAAINFYRCASGVYGAEIQADLFERCRHTLSHPSEMLYARDLMETSNVKVKRAWAFWAVCWIGRKGRGGTASQLSGNVPSVRHMANGGSNASRIRSAAVDLALWAEGFRRCEWEQKDFRDVLSKVADCPACAIYADPPWVSSGHEYLHRFQERDHVDLAVCLCRFRETSVVVRYGDDPLVRDLYRGWLILPASSRNQANAAVDEIWVLNAPARAALESRPA